MITKQNGCIYAGLLLAAFGRLHRGILVMTLLSMLPLSAGVGTVPAVTPHVDGFRPPAGWGQGA